MNTTVSEENKNHKIWEPNREGVRFKEFLELKKKDSFNIDQKEISDQASLILSKCINPHQYEKTDSKSTGLVIGQVQSGKTLSMTAVAAMAKDNGFGIVIVMSGYVTPLSNQTAGRIAKELQSRRIIRIINNPKDSWGEQDTNKVRNFIDNFKDQKIPKDRKKTLLIISHKNPAKIRKLIEIMTNEKAQIHNIPTLIIDDESDHHSLNSKDFQNDLEKLTEKQKEKIPEIYKVKENDTWQSISDIFGTDPESLKEINNLEKEQPNKDNYIFTQEIQTATFSEINNLRSVFSFHTYLGYTATPQALTVIDQLNNLRPSFVHPLPPGQGYTGLNFFFPQQEDKFSHVNSFHINSIEENIEDIISNNSRPESLVRAVHTFIIGVAFGLMDQEDSDEDKNRSMIIHPHNETSAHKKFYDYTKGILNDLKNGLAANKLDGGYLETIESLKKSYIQLKAKNNPNNIPEFNEDLLKYIDFAISETLLTEFNARLGKIDEVEWKGLYSAILVGGVGLERGYTVKGLTVSYISRNAGGRQQDTLLQRARFFGYHKNYQDLIQIYLSTDLQEHYQTIAQINNNMLISINDFIKKNPNKDFKEWAPIYLGTNASKLELTRKGLRRSQKEFKFKINHPIVNRGAHLLSDLELNKNLEIYLKFKKLLEPSLIPVHELPEILPEYKEWAKNRSMFISKAMRIKDVYELFKDIKFHNFEWRNFLHVNANLKAYAEDEREKINSRICPIIFMNYKSKEDKDRIRSCVPNSKIINPFAGKNSNYNKENPSTYKFFPGDRLVHYDFLTGKISPNTEKPVGDIYPSLQIHFFETINNNGDIKKDVPYFSIFPSTDLWMDLIKIG